MTVSSTNQLQFPQTDILNPAASLGQTAVFSSSSANSGLVDPFAGRSLSASSSSTSRTRLPYPGNDYIESKLLDPISGRFDYMEEIGGEIGLDPGIDLKDFIEIMLPTDGDLTLSLTGLTTDADLYLMRDFDNDLIPDLNEYIANSPVYIGSNTSEFIQVSGLAAGTYYVFIHAWEADQIPIRKAYTTYTLSVVADAAGETLSDARNVGHLGDDRQTFKDYLGTVDPYTPTGTITSTDTTDIYRFELKSEREVEINLSGLTADANVHLIQDFNRNGVLDSDDEILGSSNASGTTSGSIKVNGLARGEYYVRVTQGTPSSNTNYTLQLSTKSKDLGQTYSTAAEIGVLTGQISFPGNKVDSTANDRGDLYAFSLDTTSDLRLDLSNLSEDANLYLVRDVNNNNVVDSPDWIASSAQTGLLPETITRSGLVAGRYFVYVEASNNSSTNYRLTLTADGAGGNYSTARNVGLLNNTTRTFTDFVSSLDTLDTYRFQLNTTNTVEINLDGLTENANLFLARDANGNGRYDDGEVLQFSALSGTTSEQIQFAGLSAGTYFVFVDWVSDDTNYRLSLSTEVQTLTGTFKAETFTPNLLTTGTVVSGNGNVNLGSSGARDTLDLSGVIFSTVQLNLVGINGGVAYNPGNGTRLFDRILLPNGHEILFEGIDRIRFADGDLPLSEVPNDPFFSQQLNLHLMGVHNAWRFTTGASNVAIGVEDTGLGVQAGALHPDLDPSRTFVFADNTNHPDEFFYDGESGFRPYSHGTAVQSVIAAASDNGLGMSGINWQATVYNFDVLGGNLGDLSKADATRAMIQAANNRGQRLIINFSLGGGAPQPDFDQLVAQNPNVLFVISSGNDADQPGYQPSLNYPASLAQNYDNVIAVGAIQNNGIRADYSNYGTGLSLVGPTDVIAAGAFPTSTGSVRSFGYLVDFNGTSAAAPNVTGVASLVWSANPNLTAFQVHEILQQTAYDLGAPGDDLEYGSGVVNADAAVRRALALAQNPAAA